MRDYTVIGLWHYGVPVVAGVILGDFQTVDTDPRDEDFGGRWATSVEAESSDNAEQAAILAMLRFQS